MTNYTFQSLFDFTRTTSGTFVGSNGLIQTTPASVNLLLQTQAFNTANWNKTAATVTADSTTAPDGTLTADAVFDNTSNSLHFVQQAPALTAGQTIVISFYAKANTLSRVLVRENSVTGAFVSFDLSSGTILATNGSVTGSITSVGNGWYRCAMVQGIGTTGVTAYGIFTLPAGGSTFANATYVGTGQSLFLWGAQLQTGSTATDYTRNNGGVYPPRFDYDPATLQPKGILIEEQRVNLLLRSEEFDNGIWSKFQATVTANATVSPDGVADADALVEDANTGTHFCQQSVAFTTATAYTFSTYVKAGTRTWCLLLLPTAAFGASTGSFFGLSGAGSLGGTVGSPTARTITAVGNGWYRVTITATSTATTSGNVPISAASADNTNSYAGVSGAQAIYLYGAQLEAGAFATSYIPTVASQVTRTADQTSIVAPMFAPWYNQSEGSFVLEATGYYPRALVVRQPLTVSDGTASNYARLITYDAFFSGQIVAGGATQADMLVSGAYTQNVTTKFAMALQTNNSAICANGGAVVTDTSCTLPSFNRMELGSFVAGQVFNGHIRSIRYYPVRLADFQLQALTA